MTPTTPRNEGRDPTVDTMNAKLSAIEQTWQGASAAERRDYLDELAEMAVTLQQVTGAQAANAQWLTRRLHRVIRHINDDTSPLGQPR